MKRHSFIKILSALALVAIVMFTVNVQEVHYLFTQHHQREKCENHLHAKDKDSDCAVCKFNISFFIDEISPAENLIGNVYSKQADVYVSPVLGLSVISILLRGPPVLV